MVKLLYGTLKPMSGPEFLNKKYQDLPGSKPVERAVQKVKRKGEKVSYERSERIEAYLDRLEDIVKNPSGFGKEKGDRGGFELLKYKILKKYVTKPGDIPESYWKLQEKIMRDRGQGGDWERATKEQKEELKKENSEGVLADQRSSLEQWIDEFASGDLDYVPRHFKYWVFRNILGLQEYDKKKKEFPKRSKGTIKQFPDINHDALAYVIDAVDKKLSEKGIEFGHDIQPEEQEAFTRALEKEDFAKLYAWANELMNPIPEHLLPIMEGEWRRYEQGADHAMLVQSIRGKGTGWCTAGEQTAKSQLQGGDFHVFYSLDDEKKPTIPRIAIRMENDRIAEVRGIAFKQNLDPYMTDVLAAKLEEFPDKEQYLKKDADMKLLTEVERKTQKNESLTRDELKFLYELNHPIEGFGYQKDPRIRETRSVRNPEADMPIVFNCEPEQIARSEKDLERSDIKAYVGPLFPGFFKKLPPSVRNVYERFPDQPITFKNITLGGESLESLKSAMTDLDMKISKYIGNMLEKIKMSDMPEDVELVILSISQLGFPKGAKRIEIYATAEEIANGAKPGKAQELGLDLAPAEAGPQLCRAYSDQPQDNWILIGMEPIIGSDGCPEIFGVNHYGAERWLSRFDDGGLANYWAGDNRFAFLLRSPSREASNGQSKAS